MRCSAGSYAQKEGLIGIANVRGGLGCSDHEMLEFGIKSRGSRAENKFTTLEFREQRPTLGLFKDLLGSVLWHNAVEEAGAQESRFIFTANLQVLSG